MAGETAEVNDVLETETGVLASIFPDEGHPMRRFQAELCNRMSQECLRLRRLQNANHRLYDLVHDFEFTYDGRRQGVKDWNPSGSQIRELFNSCRTMMGEICTSGLVGSSNFGRILDMCCAPGGFSSKLLDHYPNAQIESFSLPPMDGTRPEMLAHRDPRLNFRYEDVHNLATAAGSNVSASWLDRNSFDIVIADGAWADGGDREERFFSQLDLILAQTLLMLKTMKPDGTFITRTRLIKWTVLEAMERILLEEMFEKVHIFRPSDEAAGKKLSRNPFFFLICTGLKAEQMEEIEQKVEAMYMQSKSRDGQLAADFLTEDRLATLEVVLEKQNHVASDHSNKIQEVSRRFVLRHRRIIEAKNIEVPEEFL